MELLSMILMLSALMWYVIDRAKVMWADLSWGKYITMLVSACFGAAICYGYKLDIVYALGLSSDINIVGQALTVLVLMSGSSAVSEIIAKVKG